MEKNGGENNLDGKRGGRQTAQWVGLILLSALIAGLLELIGIPAALLLGPLFAGIVFSSRGAEIRVPQTAYVGSQAVIGTMIAGVITPAILHTLLADWPLFFGVILTVIFASGTLGAAMSWWRVLPGTTAVWGTAPGAASAMLFMAEAYGADARLVAFMLYMRVIMVATMASLVARFIIGGHGSSAAPVILAQPDWTAFLLTLLFIACAAYIGKRTKIPAGQMLIPLVAGATLHGLGWLPIELPPLFLALCYAMIGWTIGLRFTPEVLRSAVHALPRVVAGFALLITFCAGLGWLLTQVMDIDLLSAYLATSPGGMDSIAIIAASTNVDLPFVMAMQATRFILVLLLGPLLARLVAKGLNRARNGSG